MEKCPNFSLIAWRIDAGHVSVIRLRCKKWSCTFCAPQNAMHWRKFLFRKLPEVANGWQLVTLTAHSKLRGYGESMDNLRKNLDRLIKRMKRIWQSMQYVRVFEIHPSGEAVHCHMIVSGLTPYVRRMENRNGTVSFKPEMERRARKGYWSAKTWLKVTCCEIGIGYIADVTDRRENPMAAARYITKYLTKGQGALHTKGLRHVQTSRAIGSPDDSSTENWQVTPNLWGSEARGLPIKDLTIRKDIPSSYWRDNYVYPPDDENED